MFVGLPFPRVRLLGPLLEETAGQTIQNEFVDYFGEKGMLWQEYGQIELVEIFICCEVKTVNVAPYGQQAALE